MLKGMSRTDDKKWPDLFFFSLPVLISTSYFQRLNKDRWIICLGQWGPSCILNSYIHQQLKWK